MTTDILVTKKEIESLSSGAATAIMRPAKFFGENILSEGMSLKFEHLGDKLTGTLLHDHLVEGHDELSIFKPLLNESYFTILNFSRFPYIILEVDIHDKKVPRHKLNFEELYDALQEYQTTSCVDAAVLLSVNYSELEDLVNRTQAHLAKCFRRHNKALRAPNSSTDEGKEVIRLSLDHLKKAQTSYPLAFKLYSEINKVRRFLPDIEQIPEILEECYA